MIPKQSENQLKPGPHRALLFGGHGQTQMRGGWVSGWVFFPHLHIRLTALTHIQSAARAHMRTVASDLMPPPRPNHHLRQAQRARLAQRAR